MDNLNRPVAAFSSTLTLDESLELPLFLQVARGISDAIRSGRLRPGERLPSSRRFAEMLEVHRNTVLAAYSELAAEGWIETAAATGTFVSRTLADSAGEHPVHARKRSSPSAASARTMRDTPAFPLARSPRGPYLTLPPAQVLLMGGGMPDMRLLPSAALARAYRRALRTKSHELLSYGDARGHVRLRRALAGLLSTTRDVPASEHNVLVTRGSQMALDLIARTLLVPGDVVLVENIGYAPAWQALASTGAELVGVRIDRAGIDIAHLTELAHEHRIRAVYITPHHQYPTMATLSAARRLALLELAARKRFAIIEDDYDHEFHYQGQPVLPLASNDPNGSVIYLGTLSKIFAPGLRIGYLVAPEPFIEQAAIHRSNLDRSGDPAVEYALAELIEDGEIQRHARRVRRIYTHRRQALADALRRELDHALTFSLPKGGLSLWVRVLERVDPEHWAERALQHGVLVHPGRRFAFDGRARPFLRMGFAAVSEPEIKRGVTLLSRALKDVLTRPPAGNRRPEA